MIVDRCRVCNSGLSQKHSRCPYCGYGNKVILTVSNDDSLSHREEVLGKIKKISISADIFRYNENKNGFEKTGTKSLFKQSLDGLTCYKSIVKSDEWIAHFDGAADIVVNYTFGGAKESVSTSINPDAGEGLWYLALHINEELRLEVGLCVVPVGGKGSPSSVQLATVDLDLIA